MRRLALLALFAIALPLAAQQGQSVAVDVLKQPYKGARNVPELSMNPDYIHAAGLEARLEGWGATLTRPIQAIRLREGEEGQYGAWHRLGLANGHFADAVRAGRDDAALTVGLEANCSSLLGMLAGLKYTSSGEVRRVGLFAFEPNAEELLLIVPLVERGVSVESLVALEPDEIVAQPT